MACNYSREISVYVYICFNHIRNSYYNHKALRQLRKQVQISNSKFYSHDPDPAFCFDCTFVELINRFDQFVMRGRRGSRRSKIGSNSRIINRFNSLRHTKKRKNKK